MVKDTPKRNVYLERIIKARTEVHATRQEMADDKTITDDQFEEIQGHLTMALVSLEAAEHAYTR